MDNRGVAAIAALWLCLAATAVSIAALDLARRSSRRSAFRAGSIRHLYSGGALVIAAHGEALASDALGQPPELGGAVADRFLADDGRSALLRIRFPDGGRTDVGWRRTGDAWIVSFWREP